MTDTDKKLREALADLVHLKRVLKKTDPGAYEALKEGAWIRAEEALATPAPPEREGRAEELLRRLADHSKGCPCREVMPEVRAFLERGGK